MTGANRSTTRSPVSTSVVSFTASRYTGKERDTESGLDYFGARYYSSNMGRFMSPDPSGLYFADPTNPQSLNLYAYVQNNPLVHVDPTGLDCVYVNNDTGQQEGFNRGDCDNSTDARANTGHYVDGNVNQISYNGQGQVLGYSANSGDGFFDTPGANSGPAASTWNTASNNVSISGNSVTVTATTPQGPNTIGSTLTTLIPNGPLQPPNPNITHYVSAWHPNPHAKVTGDPACYLAPDAVSAIHSIQQGNAEGPPQASTDGEGAVSINQNTTAGARSYGNKTGYAGAAAGFMILDSAVSVANCLQGR